MANTLKIKPKPTKRSIEAVQIGQRLRFSVSLVTQGENQFYSLTMPSEVLARTCRVSRRAEDPQRGFQRGLDRSRAEEIANYIDHGGTIPQSIVLSAQKDAELRVVGQSKTIEFSDTPGAFFVLDGQHRVYGFSLSKTRLRVPVVIFNGLSIQQEVKLFIDINTKQKPVPNALLLDIKSLAELESSTEQRLRELFDQFDSREDSAILGYTSRFESSEGRISRVTFNSSVKPVLDLLVSRSDDEIYNDLNAYLLAIKDHLLERGKPQALSKPAVFRAIVGIFRPIATRVGDKNSGRLEREEFFRILAPMFQNLPMAKLSNPGGSWVTLREYLERRFIKKTVI